MSIKMARIGDICSFQNGGTPSRSIAEYYNGSIPWITSADMTSQIVNSARSYITDEAIKNSATNLVPKGTVLLVTRTIVGKVAIAGMDLCFSQDITAINPESPEIHLGYLVHFLRSQEDYFTRLARGATIRGIARHVIEELEIPLCSLPEQRRIAAILDQAEALRAKRREALAQLDGLAQAIFLEMFGEVIGDGCAWELQPISSIVSDFESGKSVAAADEDSYKCLYRILKVSAITSLYFKPEESKPAPVEYIPKKSYFVKAGDLLFSRANTADLIGATAIVDADHHNLLLSDKIWRFLWRDTNQVEPRFVHYLFRQRKVREEISRRATGTSGSMKNISQKKLLSIRVGLPPIELQRKFSKREEKLAKIKKLFSSSLSEMNSLFASLQHRAFRGEL